MSGNNACERPVRVAGSSGDQRQLRCRNCAGCFRALRRYWAAAVAHEIESAELRGCRTWFGTLTFRPSALRQLILQAQDARSDSVSWDKLPPFERVQRVQAQTLHEAQKYWKRLRRSGMPFRYFLASERQESGAPHLHWVLHETDPGRRIRRRDLEAKWPHGFIAARVVKAEADGTGRKRVSAYVTKVLESGKQPRVCASQSYRPANRSVPFELGSSEVSQRRSFINRQPSKT